MIIAGFLFFIGLVLGIIFLQLLFQRFFWNWIVFPPIIICCFIALKYVTRDDDFYPMLLFTIFMAFLWNLTFEENIISEIKNFLEEQKKEKEQELIEKEQEKSLKYKTENDEQYIEIFHRMCKKISGKKEQSLINLHNALLLWHKNKEDKTLNENFHKYVKEFSLHNHNNLIISTLAVEFSIFKLTENVNYSHNKYLPTFIKLLNNIKSMRATEAREYIYNTLSDEIELKKHENIIICELYLQYSIEKIIIKSCDTAIESFIERIEEIDSSTLKLYLCFIEDYDEDDQDAKLILGDILNLKVLDLSNQKIKNAIIQIIEDEIAKRTEETT